jgi:hypothetical protein
MKKKKNVNDVHPGLFLLQKHDSVMPATDKAVQPWGFHIRRYEQAYLTLQRRN